MSQPQSEQTDTGKSSTGCPKCGMDDWHCDSEMDHEFFRQGPKCRAAELEQQVARLTLELSEARFRPMGDNHHNAAACPYCNPKWSELQAENAHLKAILKVSLNPQKPFMPWTSETIAAELERRKAE